MKNSGAVETIVVEGRRTRRIRRFAWWGLGAILVAGGVLYGAKSFFVHGTTFRIASIEVSGNKMVSSSEIAAFFRSLVFSRRHLVASILGDGNLLSWPSSYSEEDVRALPAIRAVTISKDYVKKTISLVVEERVPYGLWCAPRTASGESEDRGVVSETGEVSATSSTQGSTSSASSSSRFAPRFGNSSALITSGEEICRWFDSSGMMFKEATPAEGNLIRRVDDYTGRPLGVGSSVLDKKYLPALISIFHALEAADISVREVRLRDAGLEELEVLSYDGPSFLFSLRFGADSAPSVLQSIRAQSALSKLEYIDFRVEGRVFYK